MNSADWWAKKLAQPQQPQQNQPAPQQPTYPQRDANMPVAPSQVPMTPFEQPQSANPASKAQSSRQTESCPDCGSPNYLSVQNTRPRCYDCGYPLEQSGSKFGSLTGAHVEGNPKAARGNDQVNNYNPQQIVGRID